MRFLAAFLILLVAASPLWAAFAIFQVNTPAVSNSFLLLETSDFLLLETGDKLVLE